MAAYERYVAVRASVLGVCLPWDAGVCITILGHHVGVLELGWVANTLHGFALEVLAVTRVVGIGCVGVRRE